MPFRDNTAEQMIKEFFGRPYVVRVPFSRDMAEDVRRLIRTHRGLTTLDAAHVATALRLKIPLLETFDDRLIALDVLRGRLSLGYPESEVGCFHGATVRT